MSPRITRSLVTLLAVTAAAAVAACSPRSPGGGNGAAASDSASRVESDSARRARLARAARSLARTEGCTGSEQCRVAPLGHRACGGPRDYLAYCALTTDSAVLFGKLEEVARAEDAYQRANGVVSTCEMRLPPAAGLSGGRCAATPPGGGAGGRDGAP